MTYDVRERSKGCHVYRQVLEIAGAAEWYEPRDPLLLGVSESLVGFIERIDGDVVTFVTGEYADILDWYNLTSELVEHHWIHWADVCDPK